MISVVGLLERSSRISASLGGMLAWLRGVKGMWDRRIVPRGMIGEVESMSDDRLSSYSPPAAHTPLSPLVRGVRALVG
jgi:hypothetical protein